MKTKRIKSVTPIVPQSFPRWMRYVEMFIRTKIFGQPRYFIDRWTIEEIDDAVSLHGFNIEDELAKILTEEIEREKQCNQR